eukprot:GHVP01070236.1.p1 GENE.GHVP01070236.1~~GHVP01070236.1.p1  ORF type:complete len:419 (+),score=93.24 GHVP01070236.1:29-1285(+)
MVRFGSSQESSPVSPSNPSEAASNPAKGLGTQKTAQFQKAHPIGGVLDESPTDPGASFGFFKGKTMQDVDFTAKFDTGKNKHEAVLEYLPTMKSMFRATTRHMEELAVEAKIHKLETPTDKLSRLRNEIRELQEVANAFLDSRASVDGTLTEEAEQEAIRIFSGKPRDLLLELEKMELAIDALVGEPEFQDSFEIGAKSSRKKFDFDKCMNTLTQLHQKTLEKETDISKPNVSQSDDLTECPSYEFYYVPTMNSQLDKSRLLSVEAKLAELESIIGITAGAHLSLPQDGLLRSVREILEKLSLVDSQMLENLHKKARETTIEIDNLLKKKDQIYPNNSPTDQQVVEMFDLYEKWSLSTSGLSSLVERLRLLKSLHQEAAGASSRLDALEKQQDDLRTLLVQANKNLGGLEEMVEGQII